MKLHVILVTLFILSGCSFTKQGNSFIYYEVEETNKSVKAKYRTINSDQAYALIESFANSKIADHRNIVVAASKNKENEISLFSSCKEQCEYVISVYYPCSGDTQYYFRLENVNEKPKFTFVRTEEGVTECCFGPKRSWLRRILHI